MTTLRIHKARLIRDMNETMEGQHHYAWGGKPALGLTASQWTGADCSGYVRWLLYNCAGIRLPEGSWGQAKYCMSNGFKVVPYEDRAFLLDSRLRIAFITATKAHAGHVWLVINGKTIESYGGHGPGRRSWDTGVLSHANPSCFVLSDPLLT